MPFTLEPREGYLLLTLDGVVSREEIIALSRLFAERYAADGVSSRRLVDTSAVTRIELRYGDVVSAVTAGHARPNENLARTAIVAVEPHQVGFARMYQALTASDERHTAVFSTLPEAERWLMDPSLASPARDG